MRDWIKHFFADIKTDLFYSSLLLSGSLVAQFIAFLAYPLLTRLYTPGQFGEFSVFLSISGILGILATGRFEYALMLPEKESEAVALRQIALWWSFTFSIVCFAGLFGWGMAMHRTIPGQHFIALYVFLAAVTQIFTFYQNRLKRYGKMAQVSVIQTSSTSVGKITFGATGFQNTGLIWGSLIGQFAACIAVSSNFLKENLFTKPENIKELIKQYAVFPKYRMVQAFINSFSSNLPIFFITLYFSAQYAGYFALILGIGNKVTTVISSSLYQVLYRKFSEQKNRGVTTFPIFIKILLLLGCVCIIPAIPLYFYSDNVVAILFGKNWLEAGIYMRIMLPWLVLVFVSSPFAFIADVFSLQKKVLLIDIGHLATRILALFIGLWYHNVLLSVALYTAVSSAFLLFYLIWYIAVLKKPQEMY